MKTVMVNIGGFVESTSSIELVKTMALGSSIAIVAYSTEPKMAMITHVALPDSKISKEKAKNQPGYFADTAIKNIIKSFKKLGVSSMKNVAFKIVGGATVLDSTGFFSIGERNIKAVEAGLKKAKIKLSAKNVGGVVSRMVWIKVSSGELYVSSAIEGITKL